MLPKKVMTFWMISNTLLALVIGLFMIENLTSTTFLAVPRWVKAIWVAVVFYAVLVLFDTSLEGSLFGFTTFIMERFGIEKIMYVRTNAMFLWVLAYLIIKVIYKPKSIDYIKKHY